jgi:hypothetical protein
MKYELKNNTQMTARAVGVQRFQTLTGVKTLTGGAKPFGLNAAVERFFTGLTRFAGLTRLLRVIRYLRFIRLSIMRRLEKNPKDFLKFVKIRLKLKMKRKIREIRVIGYAELTFRG